MKKLSGFEPQGVFNHFEKLTQIPRGSGNMQKVSEYCVEFAKEHSLKFVKDSSCNVVIYKDGTAGYENSQPVILQGHLDMVCQKDEGVSIDFENDGLDIYVDGDYIRARGTTLGADNGIAVAMVLSILEREDITHPPIVAVFTTDEEIGMVGAKELSLDILGAKRMINIDSEDSQVITVSCAGGSDFVMTLPLERSMKTGTPITICIKGLLGGHSGVEINSGRINANILMGRILNHLAKNAQFDIISIDGGEKGNAIPVSCTAKILAQNADALIREANEYAEEIKVEISCRESGLTFECELGDCGEYDVIEAESSNVAALLLCAPNGVMQMSAEIEGLVETSLNLGILRTSSDKMTFLFALRSNKSSALRALEERLVAVSDVFCCSYETGGHYPPWEFNSDSSVLEIYKEKYAERFGCEPRVEAIHAGLECGVFASGIDGFDGISVGPEMHDIHTPNEKLSISSTHDIYELILDVLSALK